MLVGNTIFLGNWIAVFLGVMLMEIKQQRVFELYL